MARLFGRSRDDDVVVGCDVADIELEVKRLDWVESFPRAGCCPAHDVKLHVRLELCASERRNVRDAGDRSCRDAADE